MVYVTCVTNSFNKLAKKIIVFTMKLTNYSIKNYCTGNNYLLHQMGHMTGGNNILCCSTNIELEVDDAQCPKI